MIQVAVQQANSKWQGRRALALCLARLLVTGVLLAIAFQWVDFGSVVSVLAGVDGRRFMLSMVAFAGAQMLFAKRTQMLLMLQNMPASVLNVFSLNLASAFYTLVFPTSLAGGLVRWHRMSSVDGERAQAFSVLLLERILDNYSWLIFLCVASASLSLRSVVPFGVTMVTLVLLGVLVTAGGVVLVMVRGAGSGDRLDSERLRLVPHSVSARINNIVWALRRSLVSPRRFMQVAGVSLAVNAIFQTTIYSLLLAFVPDMGLDQYLFVSMLTTILVQLPLTMAGIGLNETVFGSVLPLLGMSNVSAVSVGVAGSAVNVIWSLIGGVFELVGLGGFRKRPDDRSGNLGSLQLGGEE
ncbi:MAG: lysylphosphatidylglycerol synthase transmembrane domain-containing protein [Anaerolineae bacterium]